MNSLVQSFDEFHDLVNNFLSNSDFTGVSDDESLQADLALLLLLLEDFYDEHKYSTAEEVLSQSFKTDIEKLRTDLSNQLDKSLNSYIERLKSTYDAEYELPSHILTVFNDYSRMMHSSVDTMVYQLYYDGVNKAEYYTAVMGKFVSDFNINSNFRRLVKRLSENFNNNFRAVKSGVERDYLKLVYGEDALFYWVPSGRNTCEWCYMIADESPLPLSEFPVDHINGACTLVPANEDEYSSFYKSIIEG